MGYSGLATFGDSDHAADFVYTVFEAITEKLKAEVESPKNTMGVNTSPVVNAALFAEAFLLPCVDNLQLSDELDKVLHTLIGKLEAEIEAIKGWEAGDEMNAQWHRTNYERMLGNVKKIREGLK